MAGKVLGTVYMVLSKTLCLDRWGGVEGKVALRF